MYTKLFEKIVDSSIWMESAPTCKVWITLLATKKSDHIARYGSVANLSRRAGLTLEETEEAVRVLESPDPHRPDQEFEGRRIERVPDGWFVLNGEKYQSLKTAEELRERDRERLKRWREAKRAETLPETFRNAVKPPVDVDLEVEVKKTTTLSKTAKKPAASDGEFDLLWEACAKKIGKGTALKAYLKAKKDGRLQEISAVVSKLEALQKTDDWAKDGRKYQPHLATWLNRDGWDDEAPVEVKDEAGEDADLFDAILTRFLAKNPQIPKNVIFDLNGKPVGVVS